MSRFTLYGMNDASSPGRLPAPFSIMAISALLWSQGAIWAGLGALALSTQKWLHSSAYLLAVVFLAFAVLSWVLAVLLPRRGSAEGRLWIIGEEIIIMILGLAILGLSFFIPYLFIFVALFDIFGIFMAGCAVAGLLFGSAREYCLPRAAGS